MQPEQSTQPQVDQVTVETSPLYLPITDEQLIAIMNDAEKRGNQAKSKLNIEQRSKENVEYWKGNQVDETKIDARYQQAHVDNVVHQDLENQIKVAVGRMPDIYVAPPDSEEYNLEAARDIQQVLRERLDGNTIKRLIKNGLRNMNLKYLAAIKPRWDYLRRDYVFELVDPNDLVFCEGAKIPEDGFTIDGTDVFFHYVEEPTQVVLAKFKKKSAELLGLLSANAKEIPSRIKYSEVQFRWYDTQGRMHEGIAWRYGNLILDKMNNPYYDYDNPEINYFDRPRKTLILFSYLNLGDTVYETTTAFEQGKPINRIINKRRRQITEISDRAVPKLAFSGKAMTKEQARNISPSPNEGILLNDDIDDVRKGVFIIPATPPPAILFNDLMDLRNRVDAVFNTKGMSTSAESASASGISKQISRESDLVTSDDLVDIVVERVVTEMAAWAMQFMRLFYDDDRPPLRITDKDGETELVEMNRKKIETDLQVQVKANTQDKTTRRADAIQQLNAKTIDPYTFMEDIDVPNPKERTKRLMLFVQGSATQDFSKYLEAVGIELDDNRADEEAAQRHISAIIAGREVPVEKRPSEQYVSTFMQFVNDSEYEQLTPDQKARIQAHIQELKNIVEVEIMKREAAAAGGQQPQQPGQGFTPEVGSESAFGGQAPQQPPQQGVIDPMRAVMQNRVQFPVTQATQPGVVQR